MAFYGAVVKPDKATAFVPPPEDWQLHLSQASLTADVKAGTRVSLFAKVKGEEPICLGTMTAGTQDTVPLDLFFTEYTEFTVSGKANVHLSGYYSPMMGDEDDEGPEDEDGMPLGMFGGDGDGESDEDEDMDEEEEEEEEEEEDSHDRSIPGVTKAPSVTIEELPADVKVETKPAGKANGVQAIKKQEEEDSDSEDGDEEDEDEMEDEELDEDEEDSEDEQEPAPKHEQKGKADGKAAATVAAAAGAKRRQEEVDAAQPSAKKQATATKPQPATQAKMQDAKDAKKQQTPQPKQEQQQKAKPEQQKTTPQPQQPAKQQQKTPTGAEAGALPLKGKKNVREYENGFKVEDVALGPANGKLAKAGKNVIMSYVGRLTNGKVFDKGSSFKFRLGVGEVIKGWDKGVEGMRVGDKRKLTIPPQMAYGPGGIKGTIPPNATLEFDVELMDVK